MMGAKPGKERLLIKRPSTVAEATAGMKSGSREGFLGEGNIIRLPDTDSTEHLSMTELAEKRQIQKLLLDAITPNSLSVKSTEVMDRRSLVSKLNRCSLDVLKRMLPERIAKMSSTDLESSAEENGITEEEKADIQMLYLAVSP